ncbi:MAG: substrate-binding domain-containing protein [Bacteroidales bacterium]|nr:substrate-binding domain-containing protein [Bacteroidales bacterium]
MKIINTGKDQRSLVHKNLICGVLLLFSFIMFSCNTDPVKYGESATTGNIKIGVDETYSIIMNYETEVFEKLYIYAKVKPVYKAEIDIFNALIKDSFKLVVAARKLSSEEYQYFIQKQIYPKQLKIAIDAIALIINKQNTDSLLTIEQLKQILLGNITNWNQINKTSKNGEIKVVFDNTKSSTVRTIIDSVTKTAKLSDRLRTLKKNNEVIDFIANNPNAIGIIGVSWISDKSDSTVRNFMNKIRVMGLSRKQTATPTNSYQPYQAYIAKGLYPLTRYVYVIDCDPKAGLAAGFASFLASDKGQRIILKSGIFPATQPVIVREIEVNDGF